MSDFGAPLRNVGCFVFHKSQFGDLSSVVHASWLDATTLVTPCQS